MSQSKTNKNRPRETKRGAALVCTVACLAVLASMLAVMMSRTMITHRQLVREANADQAYWLCQAGIQRAKSQLGTDPAYRGETWQIPAEDLGGAGNAIVEIKIDSSDEGEDRTIANVVARFPANDQHEMQNRKTAVFKKTVLFK